MNKKFRGNTARLKNFDYGSNAIYFVTINTKDGNFYFGDISDNKMKRSEIGKIATEYWFQIPQFHSYVSLDAFVLMPNHLHGILKIDKPKNPFKENSYASKKLELKLKQNQNKFGPQTKNLGSIIRGYKSGVTTFARNNNIVFDWHNLYYDHIIQNKQSYRSIKNYINNNVINWNKDEYFQQKEYNI